MQINELLLKNFGKFHDRQIDLDEGINLIHGENESGKSTIHTFIRGMLFGIERGRGRAAQNDTFSIYEPWENPNYYSGILKFKSGEKHFRIERNFDKYSKKAELICEEDGEVLSVEDGDLQMLLGEMDAERYDNTVSMSQRNAQMGESIVAELKNYATNYYTSGNGEIDLAGALEQLRGRKKILENEIRMEMAQKQQKREKLEQEVSFVWRDVHHLEEVLFLVEIVGECVEVDVLVEQARSHHDLHILVGCHISHRAYRLLHREVHIHIRALIGYESRLEVNHLVAHYQ